MPLESETYREILTNFPSGVAVVTANDASGKAFGLTVSAFCAVSLDPPLVLVCLDKTSNTLRAVEESGGFTVNLLAAGREGLAMTFAGKSDDKFAGVATQPAPIPEGGPILSTDSVGHAVCVTHAAIEAGDHWIYVGRVEAGSVTPNEVPLVYARRRFGAWDP